LGYKRDAIARAKWLLKEVNSVGAYSNSAGAAGIKESVAAFIERMFFYYQYQLGVE
jgi:alanine transaminase